MTDDPLVPVRRICLGLPEVVERLSHGEPTWFVRGRKAFVMYADHHHDDRLAFWCAAPAGAQEVLVASAPDKFFAPPYVGQRGRLGVWLDVPVDWAQSPIWSRRLTARSPQRGWWPGSRHPLPARGS